MVLVAAGAAEVVEVVVAAAAEVVVAAGAVEVVVESPPKLVVAEAKVDVVDGVGAISANCSGGGEITFDMVMDRETSQCHANKAGAIAPETSSDLQMKSVGSAHLHLSLTQSLLIRCRMHKAQHRHPFCNVIQQRSRKP